MKARRLTDTGHHKGHLTAGGLTDGLPTAQGDRGPLLAVRGAGTSGKVGQVFTDSMSKFEKVICFLRQLIPECTGPIDIDLVISSPATGVTKGHRVGERMS